MAIFDRMETLMCWGSWRIKVGALFLLLCGSLMANGQRYLNLALEGGGIRGIAYAGAFEVLEQKEIASQLRKVAGTSAGAIAGSLLCVGYTAAEIKELMSELRIQTFNDGQWFFVGGQGRMRKQYGWYKGDVLEAWIEACLKRKTGIGQLSFGQLHALAQTKAGYKDLYVTASNLSKQELAVFSWERYPNMSIATAVRASMSIPLYFRAMNLDSAGHKVKTGKGDVFVDGGLVMNYPLAVFDSNGVNKQTLGLKLERPEQLAHYSQSSTIAPYPVSNFRTYVGALYNLTIETLARKAPMEEELSRTIYISTAGITPKVKKVTRAQKELLYQSGKQATEAFFSN
jgi:NTE family protein